MWNLIENSLLYKIQKKKNGFFVQTKEVKFVYLEELAKKYKAKNYFFAKKLNRFKGKKNTY